MPLKPRRADTFRKTLISLIVALALPAGAQASIPWPDAAPGVRTAAVVCSAPYQRVQRIEYSYRWQDGHWHLVWTRRIGSPFLIGGYNPRNCHHKPA